MAHHNIKVLFLCMLFLGSTMMHVFGGVIIGDAVFREVGFSYDIPGADWVDYEIRLTQSIPVGEGLFAIWISNLGNDVFNFYCPGIAQPYSLHLAEYGLELTAAFVEADDLRLSNYGGSISFSMSIPLYETIYFGYWDDRAPFGVAYDEINDEYRLAFDPSFEDSYGWFLLQNTEDGLVMLDGATALGGGIIVGTYTQIPEPATTGLLLLGAGGLFWRCRRKK